MGWAHALRWQELILLSVAGPILGRCCLYCFFLREGAEASEDSPGNSSSIVTPAPVVAEVAAILLFFRDHQKISGQGRRWRGASTWDDSEDLYGDITDARSKDDGGEKAVEGEAEDMQKAKFEELKRLREEAEVVWEKKENVIRSQQATIGTMIESTTNPKQLALLEAKMKDLDAKLEEIKADKAKSTISITSGGVRGSGRGARGGRFGRGRGRHSSLGFRGSGVSTYVRR